MRKSCLFPYLLYFILWIFFQSCHQLETDSHHDENPYEKLVSVLNENICSVQELVIRQMNGESVAYVDSFNVGKVIMYFPEESTPVSLYIINTESVVHYPCISIAQYGENLYWMLANDFLYNAQGNKIEVSDRANTPSLKYVGDQWCYEINNIVRPIDSRILSTGTPSVSVSEDSSLSIFFPTGYRLILPIMAFQYPQVPNKAFYKDIFLDAGIGLTSRKSLYAASYLNLSLEGISFSRNYSLPNEIELQEKIISGDVGDENGRLLYPDGQPRYRLLFVNGGDSRMHGQSFNDKALNNMRQFVANGGSYVGTCAGAFFASSGYDSHSSYPYYLSVWPSVTFHTGLSDSSTGMIIEKDSPLLSYYDFGGDNYVENVRHNKGGYPVELPDNTVVLARYDYPKKETVHLQPSIWAYKQDIHTGRVLLEGSHPEEVASGERRDLTAAMIQYALDGVGTTTLKGFLQNGKERVMNKSSEDRDPYFTKLGDLQCHHFVVSIPPDAQNIIVRVEGDTDCDMALMMRHGTFAYPDSADYYVADGGSHQEMGYQTLDAGLWYIAVQCLTSVSVNDTGYGQEYVGRTDVLDGIPYKIMVSWDK